MKAIRIKHNNKTILDSILIEDEYKFSTLITELEILLKKFNMKKRQLDRKTILFKNSKDVIEINSYNSNNTSKTVENEEIKTKIIKSILSD